MKKALIAILVVSVMLALLVGCSPAQQSQPAQPAEPAAQPAEPAAQPAEPAQTAAAEATVPEAANPPKVKLGVIDRSPDEEVHIKFAESIRAASSEAGIEVLVSTPGEDMAAVRSIYDSYIAQGCNVIVDFLSAMEISQTISEDAQRDGVFHICIDANPSDYSFFYGLSNGNAGDVLGYYLADYIRNEMGGVIDMLVLMDSPTHGEDVAKRTENPKRILLDEGLITEDQVSYLSLSRYDLESVRQQVADFLTLNADKKNIVLINFASGFNDAIYSASKSQGFDDKIHLFAFDGLDATAQLLKSGEPSINKGEVFSNFANYGYDVLDIATRLVNGENVPQMSYATSVVMDAYNVRDLIPD